MLNDFPIPPEYAYIYNVKKMHAGMKRLIYLILILFAGSACKEVYDNPPQAFVQAALLNSLTKAPVSQKVTVWGIGQEYLWVKDSLLQKILLPLSSNDTTSFLISFDSKIDTVTFIHQTMQKFDSMESGFYFEFKLQAIDYTNNRIDSVVITDSLVTKKWNENIKLYLTPTATGGN
jgi:hypothetical protein